MSFYLPEDHGETREKRMKTPRGAGKRLARACRLIARALPAGERSPTARWIAENGDFLLDSLDALRRELKREPKLPALNGVPRALLFARQLTQARDGEIDARLVSSALAELRKTSPLSQTELECLPRALALALFENLSDALTAVENEARAFRAAKRVIRRIKSRTIKRLPRDIDVMCRVQAALTEAEDAEGLKLFDSLAQKESADAAEETVADYRALARRIRSLHAIPRFPWFSIIERASLVSSALREDATYPRMDRESRAYYVRAAVALAKKYRVPEERVAEAAVRLSRERQPPENEAGYFLIERPDLIAAYLLNRKPAADPEKRRERRYTLSLYALSLAGVPGAYLLGAPLWLLPFLALCFSEISRLIAHFIVARACPPRMLPRLRVTALDRATRTLVVVPALIMDRAHALSLVKNIAVLIKANDDPYLDYLLLGDFADAKKQSLPADSEIVEAADAAVSLLSRESASGVFYIQRAREYFKGQKRFMGHERKRGALDMLTRLMTGGAVSDVILHATVDTRSLRGRYRYAITLDADTFMPPRAPYQLVGAMRHPLQRGRVAVIQPRMEILMDSVKTRAQKLLGGTGGHDPYCAGVQDAYQDLFGRGSFVGKGIFDPVLWRARLDGKLPEGRLLSHDLIEGEYVRSALANDIAFMDGQPAKIMGWYKRLHRWTRGDWQLLPFLFRRDLALLSRHKIYDNMRRSLVPLARTTVLIASAALGQPLFALAALPYPLRGMLLRLALLPGKAFCCLDAAARAVYRQFISHKNLLSWVTAAQAENAVGLPLPAVFTCIFSGAALVFLSLRPGGFLPFSALGLWLTASPVYLFTLDRKIKPEQTLSASQRESVRALARDTWRFFEASVTEKGHFLPPDNVQLEPDTGSAMRTSPTNIGLYLLSCAAACEMKFITGGDMARRMAQTLAAMQTLETWRGHLYNWYDIVAMRPLAPRFVSAVDSGNLAACLYACAQCVRARLNEIGGDYLNLPRDLDAFADQMELAALYDRKSNLFYIGYDADAESYGEGHYDLLASEARLLSFVALMKKRVPLTHWKRLGRETARAGGGTALISWAGTMFEYLMPLLLLPLTRGTLIGESCLNAVREQMSAAFTPIFGVSESGYYAFDADLHYQYRAFGVRALSWTSGTEGRVVAPYASMLALPFFPRSAANNLDKMKKMSLADEQGLFEAVDYSPGRIDGSPKIVRSHMAHHQGMVLCAACNALTDFALVRRFCAIPSVRAYLYLLFERAPRFSPRRREHLPPPAPRPNDAFPPVRPSKLLPPDTCLLSGKTLMWQLNALGQSRLMTGNIQITRYLPDAGAQTGMQTYIVDRRDGHFARPAAEGDCAFYPGRAEYAMDFEGLSILESRMVDPIEDAAVVRVAVRNTGSETREIAVVSYLEISLSTFRADAAHQNFRDMTVHIGRLAENALIASRRPRDEQDRAPRVVHAVIGETQEIALQGDRAAFIGRAGDYARPAQLTAGALDSLGDTLAPCMSLRASLSVPAGKERILWLITFPCADENAARDALMRYTAERAAGVPALADTRARVFLKSLHFDASSFNTARKILARLAYGDPLPALPPPAPKNALWRHGITGDEPVWMVVLREADLPLVRQALRAHAWMAQSGFPSDLILFIDVSEGYFAPIRDAAATLISSGVMRDKAGKSGGAHLITGDENEKNALLSRARLTFHSGETIKKQLRALPTATLEKESVRLPAQPPLPPLEQDNAFGGFTADNEYCVYHTPPMPWCNVLPSARFGTIAADNGILQSYLDNSRLNRLTRAATNVFSPAASENYLLSIDGQAPFALEKGYAVHGCGITRYLADAGGVRCELSVFSPPDEPCGVRTVKMQAKAPCDAVLTVRVRFAPGDDPESARIAAESHLLTACGDSAQIAFLYHERGETEIKQFSAYPSRMTVACPLRAHEARTETFILGAGETPEAIKEACARLLASGASALRIATLSFWQERLSRLLVYGGDRDASRMLNGWLLYQTLAARLMARSGLYQAGGAYGFRDQLQDVLALLDSDAPLARAHILRCAAHQYEEGDVQHWWHEPKTGVRTRITDDLLFLPYVTAKYVTATGDQEILAESVPYLASPPLAFGEDDRYETPEERGRGDLNEHCLRAINRVRLGAHGLPLMGGGDWNDGMNRVGGASGESVWLGFFLAIVLENYAKVCDHDTARVLLDRRREMLTAAESAWTGAWYLRAWYDGGETLGGDQSDPPRIDLISQCFAVLAGANRSRAREAMHAAVAQLYDRERCMVKLLSPPFDGSERAGYICAYPPGVRENGGQYTHAVPWMIEALCQLNEYELAYEIALALLPPKHADTPEEAKIYQVEPYVMAADIYAGAHAGRGGWTWYTGSAAWTYTVWFKVLYGFEKVGDRVRLKPRLPKGHEEFTIAYRYGASTYYLTAAPDTLFIVSDGEKCDSGWITLKNDGKRHEARFPMS